MGKKNKQLTGHKVHGNQKFSKFKHEKSKKNTAVIFNEDERNEYLKGIFGAKNRRRQFYKQKAVEEQKLNKRQEKIQSKTQRRQQLEKAKELLESLKGKAKKEEHEPQEQRVEVKQEGNVVIETKFY